MYHHIVATFVVYSEWVNLAIVIAWHLPGSMNILAVPTVIYCFSSSDKCTYCKTVWMKTLFKRPKCKCKIMQQSMMMTSDRTLSFQSKTLEVCLEMSGPLKAFSMPPSSF